MIVIAIVFWICAALLIYTQVGYGLLLAALASATTADPAAPGVRNDPVEADPSNSNDPAAAGEPLPKVTLIVAAYAEADVIAGRIQNLRELDYPADLLELIVACDGSPDATAELARAAGADLVLEVPRAGKVLAQDAATRAAGGELLAFSDANVSWDRSALRRLVAAFDDERVGYVCGNVAFTSAGGDNQEGLYWRYEMFMRARESRLASITAGNGAIYAVRKAAYMELGPIMSHDIAFPFTMVKRGWRATYAPQARATEKMAPTIEGEFRRKRRMASRAWAVVIQGHMFSPRGYGGLYALMIASHRLLRYLSPLLHVIALVTSLVLVGQGWIYILCAALQAGLLLAAAAAPAFSRRAAHGPLAVIGKLLLVCRYYVATTASLGIGLWDYLTGARRVTWEPVEGTR